MENIIIICNKEEYLSRVEKFLKDNNVVWNLSTAFNIKNSHWDIHKENTIYFIVNNHIKYGHIEEYNINKDICYFKYKTINAKDLPEVKNKLNLCEILKDCKGLEFYSSVYGNIILSEIYPKNSTIVFHVDSLLSKKIIVNNKGHLILDICQEIYSPECIVFPSKDQRDWSKFVRPIPLNTPMVVYNTWGENDTDDYRIRYYAGLKNGKHNVFYSNSIIASKVVSYDVMIPFDKFNPNNIKESLKYNIQK